MDKYSSPVRVRFAPSPTGNLHIGGVRTALFNYLFALKNKGKFILRIDDTDKLRSKKEYEDSIVSDLEWFDIKRDEFYRQSERTAVYENYLNILKEKGLVYECFCNEEDILKSKELAIRSKKPYIYDGRCLHLSPTEKEEFRSKLKEKGLEPSIRINILKIGLNFVEFNDMVHGRISFNPKLFGDFILKTEGDRFTYNFASIIDDSDLNITHIIRGEDHIPNTPKQILLLKALGKSIPSFAHISLLYGKDGKMMSKRDLVSNIDYYKNAGYLPGAILNYLAITGNTFMEHNGKTGIITGTTEKEIFSSVSEMASAFDIARTRSSSAIFNEEKLKFVNEKWLVNTPAYELVNIIAEKFSHLDAAPAGPSESPKSIIAGLKEVYQAETFLKIIDFLKQEFKTVKEILEELKIFFDDFKINMDNIKYNGLKLEELETLKTILRENLKNAAEFNEISIKNAIKETAARGNKTVKDCYETLRFFLTGKLDGPSIIKIAVILGKQRVMARLS
ncbi:MAG: glutamate--tRNA ligase [Deltaproteobacteria bacterium]|jgi:glutamyl-tRNA synthetase/nondiscriminating glutamyl-tRNA synthetase|nr:glutamate--tRNA ligase [Deltaproteobacteria bacterium]MCL5880313.1 glutamate--tRNA ligase [Deltaproteobacteria bacterium]MDA8303953.1 glutamate--tRNA ligase [Deltaproteobacteria bacterium]